MRFNDSPNDFQGEQVWVGCPFCEQPIYVRLVIIQAQRRLLLDLQDRLRERGAARGHAFNLIDWEIADIYEDEARLRQGHFRALSWPPLPKD